MESCLKLLWEHAFSLIINITRPLQCFSKFSGSNPKKFSHICLFKFYNFVLYLSFYLFALSSYFNPLQVKNANDEKHKLPVKSWYKCQTSYWLQWMLPSLMPGLNLFHRLSKLGQCTKNSGITTILHTMLLFCSLPTLHFKFSPVCCKSRELPLSPGLRELNFSRYETTSVFQSPVTKLI